MVSNLVQGKRRSEMTKRYLSQQRHVDHLRTEILEMRRKVHAGHPNASGVFDLKHDAGGMVDIEFMVQFLVLANSHQYPQLISNLGNIALLRIAGELGLIPAREAELVGNAYRLLRALQHRLRLDGAEKTRIAIDENPEMMAARDAVLELWQKIFLAPSDCS
jgi:glutamate-ammonia-ligase adenylyltransferase